MTIFHVHTRENSIIQKIHMGKFDNLKKYRLKGFPYPTFPPFLLKDEGRGRGHRWAGTGECGEGLWQQTCSSRMRDANHQHLIKDMSVPHLMFQEVQHSWVEVYPTCLSCSPWLLLSLPSRMKKTRDPPLGLPKTQASSLLNISAYSSKNCINQSINIGHEHKDFANLKGSHLDAFSYA